MALMMNASAREEYETEATCYQNVDRVSLHEVRNLVGGVFAQVNDIDDLSPSARMRLHAILRDLDSAVNDLDFSTEECNFDGTVTATADGSGTENWRCPRCGADNCSDYST